MFANQSSPDRELTLASSDPSGGQRCLEAVLEIPQ